MVASDIISANQTQAEGALKSLSGIAGLYFPKSAWVLDETVALWSEQSKNNIWENELHVPDRAFFENGPGRAAFNEWLGEIHYLALTITSRKVFGEEPVRENAGWRLAFVSLPPPKVFVIGLAHHYQGTPAQSKLAEVSNFLFELLAEQLKESGSQIDLSSIGRPVQAADWDGPGLTRPNQEIGGVQWAGDVPIRLARTTTVKKMLATWITIRSIPDQTSDEQLKQLVAQFEKLLSLMVS